MVAPIDDDVAGITAARPRSLDSAVIAVAGPVSLSSVPQAFAEVTRILNVALRYGRNGVVDSSSLSVRVAVEQHSEIGEQLYRRYIADLGSDAGTTEILQTVKAYLRNRRSVTATARELTVHENTVRYRLSRYQKLTSADLADTDVLVEVWWAIEYAIIRD